MLLLASRRGPRQPAFRPYRSLGRLCRGALARGAEARGYDHLLEKHGQPPPAASRSNLTLTERQSRSIRGGRSSTAMTGSGARQDLVAPSLPPHARGASGSARAAVGCAVLVQWLRFATVGSANTVLSWCLYASLEHVSVHYLLASALAFTAGAVNSYALNRRWTFRSRRPTAPEALRFGVVQCAGLSLDIALLYVLVDAAGINHLIAQAFVFPVASAATFVLSRYWAFADRGRRPP
jgi:putative flippase GtrA